MAGSIASCIVAPLTNCGALATLNMVHAAPKAADVASYIRTVGRVLRGVE